MSNDPAYTRRVAQENFRANPQIPMATEQAIPDYTTRTTYNTELDRQRKDDSNH